MEGGDGGDRYIVDAAGDVVIEIADASPAGGEDEVVSSISYVLPDHVENLSFAWGVAQTLQGTGNALANYFYGNEHDNIFIGLGGNDILFAGAGNDTLVGGAGDDYYEFSEEDGSDTIIDDDATPGNSDKLEFGNTYAEQLWLRKQGNDLEISVIGTSGKVTVRDWYLGSQHHVEKIVAGGMVLAPADVEPLVQAMALLTPPPLGQTAQSESQLQVLLPLLNQCWKPLDDGQGYAEPHWPTAQALAEVHGTKDQAFSYTLPTQTFSDADAPEGDGLSLQAWLADGSPLPGWLVFEGWSASFSGTPGNADVGTLDIVVLARDAAGNVAYTTLQLTIADDAPIPTQSLGYQSATEDAAFSFTVSANTFADTLSGLDGLGGDDTLAGEAGHHTLPGGMDNDTCQLLQAMASFAPPAAGQMTLPSNHATTFDPVMAVNWQ